MHHNEIPLVQARRRVDYGVNLPFAIREPNRSTRTGHTFITVWALQAMDRLDETTGDYFEATTDEAAALTGAGWATSVTGTGEHDLSPTRKFHEDVFPVIKERWMAAAADEAASAHV